MLLLKHKFALDFPRKSVNFSISTSNSALKKRLSLVFSSLDAVMMVKCNVVGMDVITFPRVNYSKLSHTIAIQFTSSQIQPLKYIIL